MSRANQELAAQLAEALDCMFLQMRLGSVEDWPQAELTMPQLRTLFLLQVEQSLSMTRLASLLQVGLSSATSMVERLVEKDLVERGTDPGDRRLVTCRLTERGRQEAERFWTMRRASFDQIVQALSDKELETVLEALQVLLRAAEGRQARGTVALD